MELNLLKMLGVLLSGMTTTEAISLVSIIGGAIWVAVKSLIQFNEYVQKGKAASLPATNGTADGNKTAHEQIMIQLQVAKDKLVAIESKVDDQKFTMPKELATELQYLFKKLETMHVEHSTAHKDIGKTVADSLDVIALIKEKTNNIEQSISNSKSELKDAIKDVNHRVETASDKLGVIQGTLINHTGSRSSR